MQQQIYKNDITKIAESIGELNLYWDYRDSLDEKSILKILTEEEGLNDVENELYESNIDCISELINTAIEEKIKEDDLVLSDDEREELRQEVESRFNFSIQDLIKNSSINLRIELMSNEDMIYFSDYKNSDTLKYFKKIFRGKYKKEDYQREINNSDDYGLITFYFKVRGKEILVLREQILKGFIELRKGLTFGFFNSWVGSGSLLEIELLGKVKLNLSDWRIRNKKEGALNVLEGKDSKYYSVSIKADNLSKYGINKVYGIGGFQEW